jgi:hypothetical protein
MKRTLLPPLLCPQPEIPHLNASVGHFPQPEEKNGRTLTLASFDLALPTSDQHHVVDFVFREGKAARCCPRGGSQREWRTA